MATTNIPTVSFLRFLKHSFQILKNPLPFHHANFERLGDTFELTIGWNKKVVFSRDANFLQYVLQKNQRNYTKSEIQTRDLSKYVGHGLLTAEGAHWKQQRKLIQPGFHKKQLVTLLETMHQTISEELSKIQPGTSIDVFPVFNDLAFQVVAKSLFSGAVNPNEINRLQHITEAAQRMLVRELRQPYLRTWFRWSGTLEKHIDLVREARDLLKRIVHERRQSGQRQDDLLDMLLDARYEDGSAMDDAQLMDEILILFVAGHETTSNALTFIAELLARHPRYQEKIASELPDQLTSEKIPQLLKELQWTPMVIEEAMRLYPPAYFIDRVNLEADACNDMRYEAGTSLLFSVYEIHRHPAYWEDPLTFRPERFEDRTARTHSGHYFPFGAGPRMCIGNNFAMYEMILAVAQLMKRFQIEPVSRPIEIQPLITLKPKNANLVFQPRDQL
ncbi:cytochrome P450 [Altibacter sp. HG106]|uniref:cytochrome P450 n=1 Tax=Altibacter sp. HG106 TaxID=3023937 RepID=UPI0023502F06|nr:cytochrome P450 [Altibacter sp. HG106]MDC7994661.1 cytochrome P450 [Altibacter sp. HG106]